MSARVKLSDILQALEMAHDEMSCYLDRSTGQVLPISDEEFRAAEDDEPLDQYPEWQHEIIELAKKILGDMDNRYLHLPSKHDIHEWNVMNHFCLSIEDEETCNTLLNAIHGPGAFRMFKDCIHRMGIQDDWYKFREEAFRDIAIGWCEENNVEYVDDSGEA